MKLFDEIKVLNTCNSYTENGIYKGRIGRINSPEIHEDSFEVVFIDKRFFDKNFHWTNKNIETIEDDILIDVKIEDMEVIKESNATDEDIYEMLPDKTAWCKVENGYIVNLLGKKKNKIPYDYKS